MAMLYLSLRDTIRHQEKQDQFIIKTETNAGLYTSFSISQHTTMLNENISKLSDLLFYLIAMTNTGNRHRDPFISIRFIKL